MTQGKHITDEEKKELEKRAKASKMKPSEYVRSVLQSELKEKMNRSRICKSC